MKKFLLLFSVLLFLVGTACKKKDLPAQDTGQPDSKEKELPEGMVDGANILDESAVLFNLFAPGKDEVHLLGDFNNWTASENSLMNRTPDGKRWWIQVNGLDDSDEYTYQYLVDGEIRIADPYAKKILDPQNDPYIDSQRYPGDISYPDGKANGIVSVLQMKVEPYSWKLTNFNRPAKNDLVIYELLVRDFLEKNTYKVLADTISYLKSLGVNAVELMPVNEFEGNLSWGYNPSFYFAVDKYYGSANQLKYFIDQCHEAGIAVIMDMVLNHSFGQSPMVQLYFDEQKKAPTDENPWFNSVPKHPFNVGYDFDHESADTRFFVKNVIKFWMEEYRIDGFRFDLSKGFTQKDSGTGDGGVGAWSAFDASRIAIWKNYNDYIKSLDDDGFYVILEHFAVDEEESALAAEGMMLWNNMNYAFNEATMGWVQNSDLSRMFYSNRGLPVADHLISYMESHDEERMMYKNLQWGNSAGSYDVKNLKTALERQEMVVAFLMAAPGPKMIWQFGEVGYDVSIDQNGRTGEKPVLWNYLKNEDRNKLKEAFAKYIRMKINNPIFGTDVVEYEVSGAVKTIHLKQGENEVWVIGNFDVTEQTIVIPIKSGSWTDYVNGDEIILQEDKLETILKAGEYHIYSNHPLN
ncbi:alpha-amylase family glycosyl hydrolase [Albibacterium indicum]|uniref:alpha-amylase family glycosyl hydrolase n=1 Tax=Albibacterium indicum TaxID=2292082 RepID=UPI000E4DD978|nr:alpha-amylase family glycosyl hydrolase [Pedobacter indicus]